jgi:hypothetical protein
MSGIKICTTCENIRTLADAKKNGWFPQSNYDYSSSEYGFCILHMKPTRGEDYCDKWEG